MLETEVNLPIDNVSFTSLPMPMELFKKMKESEFQTEIWLAVLPMLDFKVYAEVPKDDPVKIVTELPVEGWFVRWVDCTAAEAYENAAVDTDASPWNEANTAEISPEPLAILMIRDESETQTEASEEEKKERILEDLLWTAKFWPDTVTDWTPVDATDEGLKDIKAGVR